MTQEVVTYQLEDRIALIGLNRPDKRNAINDEVIRQLRAAIVRASDEADAGILYGHGSNFSAGLDLAETFARIASGAPRPRKRGRHHWHEVFDLMERGPIPFVAALHGAVVGGGLELATAAHIRVADEATYFGLPEGQRGIFVGGGGTVRIQRVVGTSAMTDMMLTGRLLNAREGEQLQICRYVVAEGQSLAKAREIAQRIVQNTPETNWKIVHVLPRVQDLSHDDGLWVEQLASAMARPPETANRLKAFVEKQAPKLQAPRGSDPG